MKWGRKKSASPSSSSSSIINPLSWFSKSKLKPESNNKPETTFEFPTPKSSGCRFYSMDEDDAFWRLSFRDEGRRSTGGINPLWNDHDHDHDHFELPVSDFDITKMEVRTNDQCRNFNEMVSDIKKMRGKQRINEVSSEEKISNPGERVIFPVKEIKTKPKSTHVNKSCKSYSPRTECKIRAIEEMKRARRKSKRKEKVLEGSSVFDSCAVAKSSFDPEGDFRDSMVEMIRERGIGRAEDLEQLLACYLTLNRDEYHDLIIKVFRQVWFDLLQNRVYFDC